MTNKATVERFINAMETKDHCKDFRSKQGSLFVRDSVLYSYGTHFPLAWKKGDKWIVNDKKYSFTTSKHQSLVYRELHSRGIRAVDASVWSLNTSPF